MEPILSEGETLCEINERLSLIQRKNGLAFGTDAYLLAAFCRPSPAARAADFGCGTGVVALLLAARGKYGRVFAVEAQETFASLAGRNVELNGFSDTVSVLFRDVRTLAAADFGKELDVIVSNPPYLRADCGYSSPHDEKQIARHEVLGDLFDFTAAAARCLRYGGSFYTVYRPDRLDDLFAALKSAGLTPKRMLFVQDSPEKVPSIVLCESRLGGAGGLSVLPTLVLRASSQNGAPLTERARRVYDTGSME